MKNTLWNIKIAFRNLIRSKVATTINVVGIAIGLATSLLLLTFVKKQFKTDTYLDNYEKIYRVERGSGGIWLSHSAVEAIKENVPEIDKITCFHNSYSSLNILSYVEKNYKLEDVIFADPDFFSVFDYEVIYGDQKTCLKNPNSIVLCESQAQEIFGDRNPIGETVIYTKSGNGDGEFICTITAVIKDLPQNTSLNVQNIISQSFTEDNQIEYLSSRNWRSSNYITYILLNENADTKKATENIRSTIQKFSPSYLMEKHETYRLNPLKGIYFDQVAYWAVSQNTGKKSVVVFLGVIGILILLIAGVNYFNLVLAQSKKRLKAIGTAKIIGANKYSILGQTLMESLIVLFMALLISMALVILFIPYFNNLVDYIITFREVFSLKNSGVVLLILCSTIILFGIFPSITAIKQKVVNTLKGDIGKRQLDTNLKYGLIVFQFIITIGLIISLLMIHKQHRFLLDSDYGMDKDNVFCLQLNNAIKDKADYLEQEYFKNAHVVDIAYGYDQLGDFAQGGTAMLNSNGEEQEVEFSEFFIYGDFMNVFKLKLLWGSDFKKENTNEYDIIVNQKFIDQYGIKDIQESSLRTLYEGNSYNIIGVVDDFNFKSKHFPIEPIIFRNNKYSSNVMFVKLNTTTLSETREVISSFQKTWDKEIDVFPFEGEFMNDHYNAIYQSETRFMKIIFSFSILSILLGCLGLFGISVYMNQLRIKEIGVRKVNGATRFEILKYLNQSIIKKIIIAFIIACPVTWYLINLWLNNFAYKTTVSWWIFTLAGTLVLGVALLTVSWQSWRAARRNPVEALRYE